MPRRSTGVFQQSELQEKFRRLEEQLKRSRTKDRKPTLDSTEGSGEAGDAAAVPEPDKAGEEPES